MMLVQPATNGKSDDTAPKLPSDWLKKTFGSLPTLTYPAKVEVFHQGDSVEFVYSVASGVLKLHCVEAAGKELIVGLKCKGWLLGATQVLLREAFPVTATTLSACQLVAISRPEFLKALSADNQLSRYLNELHAREVHDQLQKLVDLASCRSGTRLAKLLYELAFELQLAQFSGGEHFRVPLKQWEIAQLLTITPEHTCRLLRRLEQQGLIVHRGRSILIANLDMLRCLIDR